MRKVRKSLEPLPAAGFGRPHRVVREHHVDPIRASHDVQIRNDVTVAIPYEPRTGALGNREDVRAEQLSSVLDGRNVRDARRRVMKKTDRGLFIRRQVAARFDRPRYGRGIQ